MKKTKSVVLTVVYLLILCVVAAVLLARTPKFNPLYFAPEYQAKFSTPETAFDGLWDAQVAGGKELYAAVLGRDLIGDEQSLTPSPAMVKPVIEEVKQHKSSAYILATGWRGGFEKIGGRWVFQNKEIGFYCRSFFRLFGIELARF